MKKVILSVAVVLSAIGMANAAEKIITLDLTKSTTALEFDASNGMWTGTYNDEETSVDSQCFSFIHSSMGEYKTWWGFTASNSSDNVRKDDTMTYQFSNMAMGGIVLNEDGTVKTDEYGAPVTGKDVPYMVGYYGEYFSKRPTDMVFADGKAHEAVGVYVNLNSYPYYCIEYGDAFARAFTNGDKYTLTIHGVAADETEKTVEVTLASYTNGNLTINRGWKYVDLSSLGEVNELYFTMSSTDSGAYGMNTPAYFCLDKLMVKEASESGISGVAAADAKISYDRASGIVSIDGAGFAMICDVAGVTLMSGEASTFDISALPAGVYIVKAGNRSVKIAK